MAACGSQRKNLRNLDAEGWVKRDPKREFRPRFANNKSWAKVENHWGVVTEAMWIGDGGARDEAFSDKRV